MRFPLQEISSKMSKTAIKISTMVGENLEISTSEMSKNAIKISTMVGENFEIFTSEMPKNALKIDFQVIWGFFDHFLKAQMGTKI